MVKITMKDEREREGRRYQANVGGRRLEVGKLDDAENDCRKFLLECENKRLGFGNVGDR